VDEFYLDDEIVKQRITQLLMPVELELYKCDPDSALLLACGMLQRSVEILDARVGNSTRKNIMRDYS
jgi:hypothetical protein